MPSSLGPAEIMVILVVALIVLGPKRLPEAGRQVGKALAEVRRWTQDVKGEIRSVVDPVVEAGPGMPPSAPVPGAAPPAPDLPVGVPSDTITPSSPYGGGRGDGPVPTIDPSEPPAVTDPSRS